MSLSLFAEFKHVKHIFKQMWKIKMGKLNYTILGLGVFGAALIAVGMYVNTDQFWAVVDPLAITLFLAMAAISMALLRVTKPLNPT